MSNELAPTPEPELPAPPPPGMDAGQLIAHALSTGTQVEQIERLAALYEREREHQARLALHDAFAAARAEMPVIPHDNDRDSATRSGAKKAYGYASLAQIDRIVTPILARHGLMFRFGSATLSEDGKYLTVPCIVTHRDGASIEASFPASIDRSGGKNEVQAHGSTVTYAKRYSLCQVLGITTAEADTDGVVSGGRTRGTVTAEEAAEIERLIHDSGADPDAFLAWVFGGPPRPGETPPSLKDMPADRLPAARVQLRRKLARAQKETP